MRAETVMDVFFRRSEVSRPHKTRTGTLSDMCFTGFLPYSGSQSRFIRSPLNLAFGIGLNEWCIPGSEFFKVLV